MKIERVTSLKVVGIIVNERLSATAHNKQFAVVMHSVDTLGGCYVATAFPLRHCTTRSNQRFFPRLHTSMVRFLLGGRSCETRRFSIGRKGLGVVTRACRWFSEVFSDDDSLFEGIIRPPDTWDSLCQFCPPPKIAQRKREKIVNNSAMDYSILLRFCTEFKHVTSEVL